MLNRVSVRVLVPALVALPVLGASLTLAWIGVEASQRSVGDLAGRLVGQMTDRVSQRVEDHVRVADTASASTMLLLDLGVLDPTQLRAWPWTLWRQWRAFDGLSGIAFGKPDGTATWIAQYPGDERPEFAIVDAETEGHAELRDILPDGTLAAELKGRFPYDLFERPWYRAGVDTSSPVLESTDPAGIDSDGAGPDGPDPDATDETAPPPWPRWSEIYSWSRADGSGDTLGISYVRPVFDDDGAFVGVLDAEIELVELSTFLGGLRIGSTGLAVITERDGQLVATSRAQRLLDDGGVRRPIWAATDEATRTLGTALRPQLEAGGDTGLARVDVRNDAWWVQVSPLRPKVGQGIDWVLVVAVPEADLLGTVRQTQIRAARASAIAAGAAVLIGMFGALLLTRPILRLRRHVRAVGEGDLETKLELGGASELAELGDEINAMQAGLKDRMALRRSLELAMDVQQALLPNGPPSVAGLDIAGHSTYCDETGGDYYDYLEVTSISPTGFAVVLGDVMGHGIAAALLMATARGVIRSRADEAGSLAEMLGHTNVQLVHDTGGIRFMTMLIVLFDPSERLLRWSSAGQGPPLLYDPAQAAWIEFGAGGLPLGVLEEESYEEHTDRVLAPGCVILLSTDGLWEAQDASGEPFDMDRVRDVIEANCTRSAEEISTALRAALAQHLGVLRPDDDVTFVIVKVTA